MSASNGPECSLVSDDMEGICVMPDLTTIKTEVTNPDEASTQNVAMGIKFILPNRFDMNVCSRFVKSLNEEDSKNIQDQVNSDLEVASVLFKGKEPRRPLCLFLFSVNEPSLCALMFGVQMLLFFFAAECNIQTSPSPGIQVRHVYTPSTTKHFSPIKQSTTLTNKHRGNEVSSTPLLVHCKSHHRGEILSFIQYLTVCLSLSIQPVNSQPSIAALLYMLICLCQQCKFLIHLNISSSVSASVGSSRRDGFPGEQDRTRYSTVQTTQQISCFFFYL